VVWGLSLGGFWGVFRVRSIYLGASLSSIFFKFIYCFIYVLVVHLLFYLYSSSSFIALFVCFKYIYSFPQCFKYIYRFHLHLLCTCEYMVIIPVPRVFGRENS
jgi:hypothetical protein